jgi:general secretion pathway protein J
MAVMSTSRPPERGGPLSAAGARAVPRAACGGFTLLEVLVAIFIFAIVVTTIFGSFNSVFSTGEQLQADAAVYEMARRCLSRMTTDLSQIHVAQRPAYVPPATSDAADPYQVLGEVVNRGAADLARLRFTSHAHLPMGGAPGGGIARIVYYPDEAADGSLVLRRADRLDPAPDFEESPADPVVCENLRAMTCVFFDEAGNPHEGWDSDAAEYGFGTPVAVGIRIEIGDGQRARVFETRVALAVFREKSE